MIPGAFDYYAPRSLGDAVKYLSAHKDDVKILSGGQSLLPLMKMRLSKPAYVLDIGRIDGLDGVSGIDDLEREYDVVAGLCVDQRSSGSERDLAYEADINLYRHNQRGRGR